jgi:hypothetical protein
MLRMLEWLAPRGGWSGREVRAYLNRLTNTASHGPSALQRLHLPLGDHVFGAWDEALLSACEGAEARGGATAEHSDNGETATAHLLPCYRLATKYTEYAAHFAFQAAGRLEERLAEEPGFPGGMSYYFRHTSRFRAHTHARVLMRLRCCSTPLRGCPSLHAGEVPCSHCPQRQHETAHHVLFHSDATRRTCAAPLPTLPFSPRSCLQHPSCALGCTTPRNTC